MEASQISLGRPEASACKIACRNQVDPAILPHAAMETTVDRAGQARTHGPWTVWAIPVAFAFHAATLGEVHVL